MIARLVCWLRGHHVVCVPPEHPICDRCSRLVYWHGFKGRWQVVQFLGKDLGPL